MYRVLVAASYPLILQGLRALLQGEADLQWVGEARSASEVAGRAQELGPDVCLVDADLFDTGDWSYVSDLRRALPDTALVIIASPDPALPPSALLRFGARGLLPRTASAAELATAIRAAAEGLTVVHPAFVADLLDREGPPPTPETMLVEPLTERELQVLQLLARGLPNKQIATRLSITEHTVKFHIRAILAKLGTTNRTEAVTAAYQRGLITL